MKQFYHTLALGLALSIATSSAQATLIDRGNGMIYDQHLDITWMADANLFKSQYDADNSMLGGLIGQTLADSYYGSRTLATGDFNTGTGAMSWWGAQAWVADLSFGGYDDWRLATTLQPDSSCSAQSGGFSYGFNCSGSELGHLFYSELGGSASSPLFTNIQAGKYWSDTESSLYTNRAWEFDSSTGYQNAVVKNYSFYGWAVRDGDVTGTASSDPVAVPEPDALWLFGAGLLGLLGVKRCNRNLKKTLQLLATGLALNVATTAAQAGVITNSVNPASTTPVLLPGQTVTLPGGSFNVVVDASRNRTDTVWIVADLASENSSNPTDVTASDGGLDQAVSGSLGNVLISAGAVSAGVATWGATDIGVGDQGAAALIAASVLLPATSLGSNSVAVVPAFGNLEQSATAVPEPGILGLFALGGLGLVGLKRRRSV